MLAVGVMQFLQDQGHTPVLLALSKALRRHWHFVARPDMGWLVARGMQLIQQGPWASAFEYDLVNPVCG